MRAHRGKFDASKPFRIITSRAAFECMQATDQLFPATENDHHTAQQREEIVVPRIEVVPRLTQPKPEAKVPLHYIRLPAALCLPRPDAYELSEVDWLFLSGLRERFTGAKEVIGEQFLQKMIVELEGRAGRDSVLPRSKGWVVAFVERNYKQLTSLPNFQEFATQVYNYWKSRREELRFPLWRPLWRPADNEFNHMLAFKAREKRSRNLRRTNRLDETDIIHELNDEYINAGLLCERIQLREQLKLRSVQLNLLAFAQECKPFAEPLLIEDFPNRNEQRDKVKASRSSVDEFKRKRDSAEIQNEAPINGKEAPNQRESVACFLANVAIEAERCGIDHDNLFPNAEAQLPALKAAISQTNKMIQELPREEDLGQKEETARFSMRRYGDMLMRSLSEDEEEREALPKDYLEVQRRRVARSYFGDDDQLGDVRDLRKVISSSFKRFLQVSSQL